MGGLLLCTYIVISIRAIASVLYRAREVVLWWAIFMGGSVMHGRFHCIALGKASGRKGAQSEVLQQTYIKDLRQF